MRQDLLPGNVFPDLCLPEHTGEELSLSEIAGESPLVLCFGRGWWCPKEQVRLRGLVSMQVEIQREYGGIAVVTAEEPYVNGAFRAGLGAEFPFLSDERRRVAEDLGLLELTDEKHLPFVPMTFVLDSLRTIRRVWCGFWFWGHPTPEELRQALREITREEQPSMDPFAVWADRGAAPVDAGIDAPVVWIREDSRGHELQRGVWRDPGVPEVGAEVSRSTVDGRPWVAVDLEHADGRVAIHLRKKGQPSPDPRFVRHHTTAPKPT
jgi:peroxiredoxin